MIYLSPEERYELAFLVHLLQAAEAAQDSSRALADMSEDVTHTAKRCLPVLERLEGMDNEGVARLRAHIRMWPRPDDEVPGMKWDDYVLVAAVYAEQALPVLEHVLSSVESE